MRPTSKEILDGISWVLNERVAPVTEDKWASSYLRSIRGLLEHVSARCETEAEVLYNDLADQRALLGRVCDLETQDPAWKTLQASVREALDRRWFDPEGYHTIAEMEAENLRYRELIADLITAIHDRSEGVDATLRKNLHRQSVDYLRRQMARERPLYGGPFSGRPF